MCLYESLIDGKLDLCDIARMNVYLDVIEYNKDIAIDIEKEKHR